MPQITIFTFVVPYCILLGYCAVGLSIKVVEELIKDSKETK